jgi:hypothetical protein
MVNWDPIAINSPHSTPAIHTKYTQNPKLPDAGLPQKANIGVVGTGIKTQKPHFQFEK